MVVDLAAILCACELKIVPEGPTKEETPPGSAVSDRFTDPANSLTSAGVTVRDVGMAVPDVGEPVPDISVPLLKKDKELLPPDPPMSKSKVCLCCAIPVVLLVLGYHGLFHLPLFPAALIPYSALVLAIASLAAQCWAAAYPMAYEASQAADTFPDVFDGAFASMKGSLQHQCSELVSAPLRGTPMALATDSVVSLLMQTLAPAIEQVERVIRVDPEAIPPAAKDVKQMQRIIFVLLIVLLALIQILAVMSLCLSGDGFSVILISLTGHIILVTMAMNAKLVIVWALRLVQLVLNRVFKNLMLKFIDMESIHRVLQSVNEPKNLAPLPDVDVGGWCTIV